jgi:hypothetical protein
MVAIARTKKTRVSRQTKLQQKLKELKRFCVRHFVSNDLAVVINMFDESTLIEVYFCFPKMESVKIHLEIRYDDKTDKKRMLRLAQTRYRLSVIVRCLEAAKREDVKLARCFTAHTSNYNRMTSLFVVSRFSVDVSDCSSRRKTTDPSFDINRLSDMFTQALAHFDSEMQRLEISLPLLDDDNTIEVVVKEPEPILDTGSNEK